MSLFTPSSPRTPTHLPGSATAVSPSSGLLTNGRWSGYRQLLLARLRELGREPEVIFWVFVFPLLMAFGLGLAFRDRPAPAPAVAVVAGSGAAQAEQWLRSESNLPVQVVSLDQAREGFRLGKYALVIRPAPDARSLTYQYDPSRPESVQARLEANDALQRGAGRRDPLAARAVVSNAPGARYIDFLIPGLLGMNLMNSGMWGIGFALVEMRQRKLLKRFVATPMRRSDFLMALMSSRLLLMVVELILLLGAGVFAFHLRIEGSLLAILLVSALGAVSFGALGLLTASRAQKIETVSGLINVVMMPMWIFSGVFFSYERFPAVLLPLIRLLPLTALNDALRSILLQGQPLAAQSGRLLVLCGWGILSFGLSLRWFRWS